MCKRDSATCMLTLMWHAPNGNVTAMTTQQQLYIHISQCHFTGFYTVSYTHLTLPTKA